MGVQFLPFSFLTTTILTIIICALVFVDAQDQVLILPADGLVTDADLLGFTGTSFHASQHIPLCGTLGFDVGIYSHPWDVGGRCLPAMTAYIELPDDITAALFDPAGVRLPLEGTRIGQGDISANAESSQAKAKAVCLCFSLADATLDQQGDICLYFDEVGRCEMYYDFDGPNPRNDYVAAAYSPESGKALPQCHELDSVATGESSAAESTRSSDTTEGEQEKVVKTSTQTSLYVSTDPSGQEFTVTALQPTTVVISVQRDDDNGPLSRSDRIALGVGLGIGIPSFLIAVWGACRCCCRR